jgi:hypothetical protein
MMQFLITLPFVEFRYRPYPGLPEPYTAVMLIVAPLQSSVTLPANMLKQWPDVFTFPISL